MVFSRDFARSLVAIFLSLTVFYVCTLAVPTADDEGNEAAPAGPAVASSDSGQHVQHASLLSESRTDRVRRAAPKDWDLPERGRERRNFDELDIDDARDRRSGPRHYVERRGGDPWSDDYLERGRERRRSLSVNHELASLADMLADSSKQRKLNKMKTMRDEYGKRMARGDEDEDVDRW